MNLCTVFTILCGVVSVQVVASEWKFLKPKIPPLEYTEKMRGTPIIYTLKQRINHFSLLNQKTFNMRYSMNNQFYNGTGPMYLFLSGEQYLESLLGYLYTGLMVDIANQTGAAMYMLEHRYYGESVPNGNLKTINLRHLRVKQALADIAEFIKTTKSVNTGLGKVIVFGGSYTATLATLARKTYPDLIDGAVAASGIYKIQINNYQYLEGFENDVAPYPNCSSTIQNGVQALDKKLSSYIQSKQVAQDLNATVAQVFLSSFIPFFKQLLFNNIIVTLSTQAQYDRISNYSVAWMCGNLTANSNQSDDYTRLTAYYRYLANTTSAQNATKETRSNIAWMYQVCTELGNFVTTTSANEPFYNKVPVSFYWKICTLIYTPLSSLTLKYHSCQLKKMLGGNNLNVTRVVFVGGSLDPWQALNIQSDLNSEAPAIVIPNTSHCAILLSASKVNTIEALAAKNRITQLVKQWAQ